MLIRLLAAAALFAATSPVRADMAGMAHSGGPEVKANAAAMDRMMRTMDVKPTGNPDKDFARMMVPHHQGAIDMARIELQYGKDAGMLALAKAIVATQETEITEMKAFLAKTP